MSLSLKQHGCHGCAAGRTQARPLPRLRRHVTCAAKDSSKQPSAAGPAPAPARQTSRLARLLSIRSSAQTAVAEEAKPTEVGSCVSREFVTLLLDCQARQQLGWYAAPA